MITEKTILDNIQKIRSEKGFSQDYVASFLGMTQGGYNLVENGKWKLRVVDLLQLAILFEKSVIDIITFSENKNTESEPIEATLQIKLRKDKKDQVLKLVFGDNNLEILNR